MALSDSLGLTYRETVDRFVSSASWLTDADLPQLRALVGIAGELDGGKFQAALVSQFTLIHRALMAKGEPARPAGSPATTAVELDLFLDEHERERAASVPEDPAWHRPASS